MKNTLKERWADICNEYADLFCKKHDLTIEDSFWVADCPGTIFSVSDYFISMEDMRYDIDNNIPEGTFDAWYWKALRENEAGLPYINYQSYCKGLHGHDEEDLKKLEDAKKNLEIAQKEFDSILNNVKKKNI